MVKELCNCKSEFDELSYIFNSVYCVYIWWSIGGFADSSNGLMIMPVSITKPSSSKDF